MTTATTGLAGDADGLAIGRRVMNRLDQLAELTDDPSRLTRLYLSTAHARAAELILRWMRDAGIDASIDAIGNVVGRYAAASHEAPTLIIGSHIDTVRDAGRYDGTLGVVAALSCVEEVARREVRLPFAIEVVAFGDEEGVRFPKTLSGSRALAGIFESNSLDQGDEKGVTLREALVSFGCDPTRITNLARRREDVLGYIEVHIEQGPVLQEEGLPVGIVTAINGATRLSVSVTGKAGHAGTVPMHLRQDPMTATAHMIAYVDKSARASDVVATVGHIEAKPGAPNVIPGHVEFTVDIRSPEDCVRLRIVNELLEEFARIARRYGVTVDVSRPHETPAVACDHRIVEQIAAALARHDVRPLALRSGAGHDAASFDAAWPIGMLFVRCRDGISHHPDESITLEDADLAVRVLIDFVRHLDPASLAPSDRKARS